MHHESVSFFLFPIFSSDFDEQKSPKSFCLFSLKYMIPEWLDQLSRIQQSFQFQSSRNKVGMHLSCSVIGIASTGTCCELQQIFSPVVISVRIVFRFTVKILNNNNERTEDKPKRPETWADAAGAEFHLTQVEWIADGCWIQCVISVHYWSRNASWLILDED